MVQYVKNLLAVFFEKNSTVKYEGQGNKMSIKSNTLCNNNTYNTLHYYCTAYNCINIGKKKVTPYPEQML